MNFKIMSRKTAEEASRNGKLRNSAVISIADVGTPNASINTDREVLFLHFDDTEEAWETNLMTKEDAIEIVHFVNYWKDHVDEFVVNCHGGCCRSAAICAAIKLYLTGDDWDVFRNPHYAPNRHCYELMLKAFGVWDECLAEEKRLFSDNVGAFEEVAFENVENTLWMKENAHLLDKDIFLFADVSDEDEDFNEFLVVFESKFYDIIFRNCNWICLNRRLPKNTVEMAKAIFNHRNYDLGVMPQF